MRVLGGTETDGVRSGRGAVRGCQGVAGCVCVCVWCACGVRVPVAGGRCGVGWRCVRWERLWWCVCACAGMCEEQRWVRCVGALP